MTSYAFLDSAWPIAMAHRGGAGTGLENSLPAFQHAVDLGYRYLETDVHATADGVLLAFHDRTLDRATDGHGRIAQLPWARVRHARIGGVEPIPRLEDLLGAWPHVRLNIDVKEANAIAPLVSVLRRTGTVDRVCVASFSDRRVARVRAALGPALCTSLGPIGVARLRLASYRRLVADAAAHHIPCAQVPSRLGRLTILDERFLEAAHRRGVKVHVWTVDEAADMRRLLDLGVDGIITDRPDTLRDVLIERQQWAA